LCYLVFEKTQIFNQDRVGGLSTLKGLM